MENPRGKNSPLNKKEGPEGNKISKVEERKKIPGVIYIGHLPWGFEEKGLKEYFSQFGTVKDLRLSRSRKTGKSKSYAFVKFAHDEVAKIAADSMNNYLMFGKLLKCHHIKEVHPKTFRGRKRKPIPCWERTLTKKVKNLEKHSESSKVGKEKNVLKRYKRKMKKLNQLIGDYTIEELENQINERRAKHNSKKSKGLPEDGNTSRNVEMDSDEESASDQDLEALNGLDDAESGESDASDSGSDDDDDNDDESLNNKLVNTSEPKSKKGIISLAKNVQKTPNSSNKKIKADDKPDHKISLKTSPSTPKRLLSTGKNKQTKGAKTPKSVNDADNRKNSMKKLHQPKGNKGGLDKGEENTGFITPQNTKPTSSLVNASKSTPGGMKRKHSVEDRSKTVGKSNKKRYFGDSSMSTKESEGVQKTDKASADTPQTAKKQKAVKEGIEAKLVKSKDTPIKHAKAETPQTAKKQKAVKEVKEAELVKSKDTPIKLAKAETPQTAKKQKAVKEGIGAKLVKSKDTPITQDKRKDVNNKDKGTKTPGFDKSQMQKLSRKQSLGTPRITERMKTPSHGKRKKSL